MPSVELERGKIAGKLCEDIGLGRIDSEHDRVILCGSPDMLAQMMILLCASDFEGPRSVSESCVVEKAFAEK